MSKYVHEKFFHCNEDMLTQPIFSFLLSPVTFNSGFVSPTCLFSVYVFLFSLCLLCPKINTYINQDVFTFFLLQNFKDFLCDSSAASKP